MSATTITQVDYSTFLVTAGNGVTVRAHAVNAAMTGWSFEIVTRGYVPPAEGLISRIDLVAALGIARVAAQRALTVEVAAIERARVAREADELDELING